MLMIANIIRINIGRGNDFKAVFTNLHIRGPSKFKIEKLRLTRD